MKILIKKPKKNAPVSFTFPALDANLDEDTVKAYGLGPALKRFGKALAKQGGKLMKRNGESAGVIGVNIISIDFTYILDSGTED